MSKRAEMVVALIIVGVACIAGLRVALKPAPVEQCIRTDLNDMPVTEPPTVFAPPPELNGLTWI